MGRPGRGCTGAALLASCAWGDPCGKRRARFCWFVKIPVLQKDAEKHCIFVSDLRASYMVPSKKAVMV